jgi:hypothetical protein
MRNFRPFISLSQEAKARAEGNLGFVQRPAGGLQEVPGLSRGGGVIVGWLMLITPLVPC